MYIPKLNQLKNKKEAVEFIRRFSFGTIITAKNKVPIATHLPFIVEYNEDEILIRSHFAKANKQWMDIENNDCY